jgi:hypothetical protein
MAALCAAPVVAVARRAVATRATADGPAKATPILNRRNIMLAVPAMLGASAVAGPAAATVPPAYYTDTSEVIKLCRDLLTGADISEANIATFQTKRDIW